MTRFFCILLFLPLFFGCGTKKEPPSRQTVLIQGRDEGSDPKARLWVYRASIPADWIYKGPASASSNSDTRLPIGEFLIQDAGEEILIAIHNFPQENSTQRIPPAAQVQRWKGQFTALEHHKSSLLPQSFSGYVGLRFEGTGLFKDRRTTMIGWALQLAPEHFLTLSYPRDGLDPPLLKQMRADVTIKVTGPPQSIEKHKGAIDRFVRTFELIHEIPTSLL